MTTHRPAQDARKTNIAYFGTQPLGCPTTRPDGKVVKVTMLDPRDPGYAADNAARLDAKRAKAGSDALLAAMKRAMAKPLDDATCFG